MAKPFINNNSQKIYETEELNNKYNNQYYVYDNYIEIRNTLNLANEINLANENKKGIFYKIEVNKYNEANRVNQNKGDEKMRYLSDKKEAVFRLADKNHINIDIFDKHYYDNGNIPIFNLKPLLEQMNRGKNKKYETNELNSSYNSFLKKVDPEKLKSKLSTDNEFGYSKDAGEASLQKDFKNTLNEIYDEISYMIQEINRFEIKSVLTNDNKVLNIEEEQIKRYFNENDLYIETGYSIIDPNWNKRLKSGKGFIKTRRNWKAVKAGVGNAYKSVVNFPSELISGASGLSKKIKDLKTVKAQLTADEKKDKELFEESNDPEKILEAYLVIQNNYKLLYGENDFNILRLNKKILNKYYDKHKDGLDFEIKLFNDALYKHYNELMSNDDDDDIKKQLLKHVKIGCIVDMEYGNQMKKMYEYYTLLKDGGNLYDIRKNIKEEKEKYQKRSR